MAGPQLLKHIMSVISAVIVMVKTQKYTDAFWTNTLLLLRGIRYTETMIQNKQRNENGFQENLSK